MFFQALRQADRRVRVTIPAWLVRRTGASGRCDSVAHIVDHGLANRFCESLRRHDLETTWTTIFGCRIRLLKTPGQTRRGMGRRVPIAQNSPRQIFTFYLREMLDFASGRAKIPLNSLLPEWFGRSSMTYIQPTNRTDSYPQSEAMAQTCLHPRVQIVSRDADSEFVECLECREIFESSEFRDMDIEAKIPTEEE